MGFNPKVSRPGSLFFYRFFIAGKQGKSKLQIGNDPVI